MPELLAGTLLLSWAAFAHQPAVNPASGTTDATSGPGPAVEEASNPDGEIVVFGELQVSARRAELDREIRQQGYRMGVRKDGRTVYRPDDPWKPTVVVFDDGFVRLKRSPVRFAPPGQSERSSRLRYLWCLPPFTPMCVRLGGQVVSNAKLEPQKARMVAATDQPVKAWREAIVKQAMTQKVGTDLPNRLDELWATGRPLEGDGPRLVPWAERRMAMLTYWSSRTCTPEGDAVAEAVALFLEYEVQESNHPITAAEQRAANSGQRCTRRLDLVGPPLP